MSDNGENVPAFPGPNTSSASVADLIEQEVAEGKLILSETGPDRALLHACVVSRRETEKRTAPSCSAQTRRAAGHGRIRR